MSPFARHVFSGLLILCSVTITHGPLAAQTADRLPEPNGLQAPVSSETLSDASIADRRLQWPSSETWLRVLLLKDYNTRVVIFGATLLGFATGTIGSFTLLRRRALMGDALSHATLPGIGLAFLLATMWGFDGKQLTVLLMGAAITGVLGVVVILAIRRMTRLKEDAALGIVLSVFFGGGVAVLGVTQQMDEGHAAGLESFIYGKTASMIATDAWLIAIGGLSCVVLSITFFKELKLLCFDAGYAESRGFPVVALDFLLMGLVTVVTIIGLQAVGLILMIALLVIPASAARFWTERMTLMTAVSGFIGGVSCMFGATLSALFSRLPSGAMIVLVAAFVFLVSMLLGTARGVVIRKLRRRRLNAKIDRQHLLRGIYEYLEAARLLNLADSTAATVEVPFAALLEMRSWDRHRLQKAIRQAMNDGLVEQGLNRDVRLTSEGRREAGRLVHEHRLWEMYLITHAEVAPSRVDRDADTIEHVLDAEMIAELERLVQADREGRKDLVLASPHETIAVPHAAPQENEDRMP